MKFSARRAIICALLFSTLFAGSVTSAPPASAATSSELSMVRKINASRVYYGRHRLQYSTSLSILARGHSFAMSRKLTIFHSSNLAYKLRAYRWRVAGENVGMGPSMTALHRAFMLSPHHRANNLYRGYTRFGVGVVWRGGIAFVTVIFLG